MNLKELKSLISNREVEVREYMSLVDGCVYNSYRIPQGEELIPEDRYMVNAKHEYTIEELYTKINELDAVVLSLKALLNEKNHTSTITLDDREITLAEAILTIKMLKSKLPLLKRLSMAKKEKRSVIAPGRYSEDAKTYTELTVAQLEPKEYREELSAIENKIISLQSKIDNVNINTLVDIQL